MTSTYGEKKLFYPEGKKPDFYGTLKNIFQVKFPIFTLFFNSFLFIFFHDKTLDWAVCLPKALCPEGGTVLALTKKKLMGPPAHICTPWRKLNSNPGAELAGRRARHFKDGPSCPRGSRRHPWRQRRGLSSEVPRYPITLTCRLQLGGY